MLMHLALYHLSTGGRAEPAAADIWPFFFENDKTRNVDGDGDDYDDGVNEDDDDYDGDEISDK